MTQPQPPDRNRATLANPAKPASETLFRTAQALVQQLQEAGWTWVEIEQICHFVQTIAHVEGYARRRT